MYKKSCRIITIFALAGIWYLTSGICSFAQENINLEYRFNKGDISKYKMSINNSVESKGIVSTKAERVITEQVINTDYTQEVKNIEPDGTMKIAETLSSFDLFMKKNEKEEIVSREIIKNFTGKKFIYNLSKKGEIINLISPEQVQGIPFTTDLLTIIFEHLQPRLPEKEINIGNTWLGNMEITAPRPAEGKIFVNFNYTFEKIEQIGRISCAYITFWGTLTSSLTAKRGNTTIDMNVIGSSEGNACIALTDGKLVTFDENLTINIITGKTSAVAEKSDVMHLQTTIKTDVNVALQK
jgi:hypothetical protein